MTSGGSFLQGLKVLMAIWRQATSLAFPKHQPQAFHGRVVGQMQGVQFFGQLLNGQANTFGLVNGALLLNA